MPAPQPSDGKVEGYERIVNGKVVKVQAYAKKPTTSTTAAAAVRRLPGRPRVAAQPGSYSSGRDLPGAIARSHPAKPAPPPGAVDVRQTQQPQ